MPTPESTSVEGFGDYVAGKCIVACSGEAWRELKARIVAPPRTTETVHLPAVSEPFLAWTISGVVEFKERENNQPWITHRIRKGSFFLTAGGAPYDCRWKTLTAEPFEAMLVFLELPLLERALEEVFGDDAAGARLRDLSGFTDETLNALMGIVRHELHRRKASRLLIQGVAQATAIHLARNYAVLDNHSPSRSPSLPGYRLRQITEWMSRHLADEFNLDQLAAQAGLSKFYFNRLFKNATGLSPSHFHISLRMEEAKRLLRETDKNVLDIAMDVGYANPSHFARLFRRHTGLTPGDYRRQR